MPITISTYTTFNELRGLLGKCSPGATFVVPTAHDGEWILKMRGGEDALFARFKAYVWSDLYREFAVQFHAKPIRQVDPPDNNLILRHIIKAYLDENPDVVKTLPGVARSGFADILGNALHELMREEVSVESLLSLDHDTPEHALLVELYRRYIDYLNENSLMDSAQVATRARGILAGTGGDGEKLSEKFVFVGFTSFTLGQRGLVLEMSRVGADILILKPEAHVAGLQDASAQFENFSKKGETSQHEGGEFFVFESADSLSELDLLARELALWAQGHGCFAAQKFPGWGEIGILTSHSRAAALEQALARFRIPTSSFVGSRVCDTAIGYLPRRIYAREFETLTAHPCLKGTGGVPVLPLLEKFCRAIERGGTPVELLSALLTLVSAKGLWLDSLFETIKHERRGNLDGELRELSSAVDELERKIIFMKELQPAIGAAGKTTFAGDGAIEFLANWARNAQTATSPAIEGAVSVFDALPPLANFEVFVITGVTAKEYPGTLVSSPLLNDDGRKKLNDGTPLGDEKNLSHLPTLHEQRVQKSALLKRLLYAGRNFTIVSRPLMDESGRQLSASPCLAPVLKSEKWREVGSAARALAIPKDEPYFSEIEICSDEKQNPRSKPIGESKGIAEVKISALDELSACPFLFWAKYIKKFAEPQRELYDNRRAGTLAHRLWELSWREKKQTREPLEKIAREVWENEEDVRSKYRELFSDNRLSRRCDALRDQIFACAALQDEIENKLNRVDVEVEEDVKIERDGVVFKGRCDRVDILKDNGIVIIDYKAGKSERKFQLGAYLIAYLGTRPRYHASGAGHISLRGENLSGTFDSPLDEIYLGKKGKKKVSDLISKTEEAINAAVETIKGGNFSPNYDEKKFCRYCAYTTLCRRAEFRGELTSEDDESA